MTDDIKLQVGLDLDALKQSATQGASILGQAFQGAMSSLLGHTLGSGLAPSQLPPGQAPMNQMLAALHGIHATLQAGFSALVAAGGGGVGGASGPPGSGLPARGPNGQFVAAGGGSQKATFGQDMMAGLRGADQFPLSSFANMIQTDFHRTGVFQFLNQALGSVPVVGKLFGLGAEYSQASDDYQKQSLDVFRSGGRDARRNFRGVAESVSGYRFLQQNGITLPEYANMQSSAASYGSYGADPLAAIQGRYGLADKGADLMRSLVHGGGTTDEKGNNDIKFKAGETEWRTFADVLAVAIGTNLDRGRWGEAFTAMSAAARRISTGNIDKEGLLATETFVGNLGARFQGDSSAHTSMVAALQGLQGGQGGGLAQIMALQAGGLGGGGGYFDAQARVDLGAAAGGIGLEDVLKRYTNLGFVQAYMQSGSEADLNRAYILLSRMLPGYKPTDIKEVLRGLRAQGGVRGPTDALRSAMGRNIGSPTALGGNKAADFLPKQEGETIGSAVSGSYKGADATESLNLDEHRAALRGGGIGGIENRDEAGAQGAFRTAPPVVISPSIQGSSEAYGNEGYGQKRDAWPTGPGESSPPGYAPGWRASRPSDPNGARHMARDIVVGSGQAGEKVYAPVDGTWLTQTPALAIAGSPDEGYVGEMVGDNNVQYKFVHLVFDATLKKGMRVTQGQFLGTVAKNNKNSKPHLHLGARRTGANGKTEVVDPMTTMGASERDIMTGKMQAPSHEAPTENVPSGASGGRPYMQPWLDKILPGGGSPVSQNDRMDVHVYVHDTRISVARRIVNGGAPGQNFGRKG